MTAQSEQPQLSYRERRNLPENHEEILSQNLGSLIAINKDICGDEKYKQLWEHTTQITKLIDKYAPESGQDIPKPYEFLRELRQLKEDRMRISDQVSPELSSSLSMVFDKFDMPDMDLPEPGELE